MTRDVEAERFVQSMAQEREHMKAVAETADRPDADAKLAEIRQRHDQDEEYREKKMTGHFGCGLFEMHRDRAYLLSITERAASMEKELRIDRNAFDELFEADKSIIAQLQQSLSDREKALRTYGRHLSSCQINNAWLSHKGCDCGYRRALENGAQG